MVKLIFKKGSYKDFKAKVTTAEEGAFYLTEDEGGLYVGLADGSTKRIQGSLIMCEDLDDLVAKAGMPPYDPNVIYFSAANNALFRYNGVDNWIQLNQTAEDATSALNALQTALNSLKSDFATYKTENDAAVADKASKADLAEEAKTARAAEKAASDAASKAQSAADAAQGTADEALTNAGANATAIAGHSTRLTEVEALAASKATMAEVEAKDYATHTDVSNTKNELIGKSSDDDTKNTIYGAKALATQAKTVAEAALPKAGGSVTGNITLEDTVALIINTDPSAPTHAANKRYVDNEITKINTTNSGLDGRLSDVETAITSHATAIEAAQKAADAAATAAQNADTKAGTAQKAADSAASAAKSANDNANTRVLQTSYDADKEVIDKGIADNATAISAANTAFTEYTTANDIKVNAKLDSSVASTTYATKTELNNAKSALLGTADDASSKETIRGAQKGVIEAKAAASTANAAAGAAQSAADAANKQASDNAAAIADEITRATAAEKTLTDAVNLKASQAALEDEVKRAKAAEETLTTNLGSVKTVADGALPLTGAKAMTGNLNMGAKKITNLATPGDDADAATKKYVDDMLISADAMEFKGVLGVTGENGVAKLPTTGVQCGWTYMVGADGSEYGIVDENGDGVMTRIGDLIINVADDNATPKWVHVKAGYQSNYLQKLSTTSSSGNAVVNLSDGVSATISSITFAKANNIEWSVSNNQVSAAIVWGTF